MDYDHIAMIVDNYQPIWANQENIDKYRQQIAEVDESIRKTKTEINSHKASTEMVRTKQVKEREKSDREIENFTKLVEGLKAQELEQQQTIENYSKTNIQLEATLKQMKNVFAKLETAKDVELAKLGMQSRELYRNILEALKSGK